MPALATPGQLLGKIASNAPGSGTHVFESQIYASVTGLVVYAPGAGRSSKPSISVSRDAAESQAPEPFTRYTQPEVGSTVLCRVTRVQNRQASTSILVFNPSPSVIVPYTASTNDELQFQAVLRREDTRSSEKDRIIMNDMFRVGDIVRAFVISLGDERNYYISTAGNEFGVVVARSEEGNAMVPASWKEMRDNLTTKSEARKVAKPV